jgi:light-regulated signal transduction histidine kinase (bacteriophytochrome)
MRQKLASQAAELEASNKELESFAYSVSHDLRAPLRHVVGYAELLHKHSTTALDDKSQHYMREIQDSAMRMGVLIDDLLGFSRVGRGETRKVVVSLQQLVQESVSELTEEARGREIAWKIATLPACYGDRSMLKLVLQNLIANAIKFTRTRERAEIEIGCTSGKPNEVVVFVRDNGIGFDMRYADKLFGVFQRLHAAEDFEGTGIGLATVQRIIHRHGGEVRAEGAPDHGATFYVSLPAQGAT